MPDILVPFRQDLESSAARLRMMNSLGGRPTNQSVLTWNFDEGQPADADRFPADRFRSASGISFVAPFAPGRLMVWQRTDARGDGTYKPANRRLIFTLDSNLFAEIRSVLIDGGRSESALRGVVDLATQASLYGAELQPIAYLREMVLHSPVVDTRERAIKAVEGLLRLHALDARLTDVKEVPVYRYDVVRRILERTKADPLPACAAGLVDKMYADSTPGIGGSILLFYATVLKMISVALNRRGESIEEQCVAVDDFVIDELHAVQPRLFALSRLFFKRRLRILRAQPGNPEFDRTKLVGSAYDVYLSTIHEEVLGDSDPPEATLSVLCTRDAGLADFSGRFPLQAVAKMQDTSLRIYHKWDDEWMKDLVGDAAFSALTRAIEAKLHTLETPRPPDQIRAIISALEDELAVPDGERLLKDGKQIYIP